MTASLDLTNEELRAELADSKDRLAALERQLAARPSLPKRLATGAVLMVAILLFGGGLYAAQSSGVALTIGPDGTITIGTGEPVHIDASHTHFTSGNGTTLEIETTSSGANYGPAIRFVGNKDSGIGSYWVGAAGSGNFGHKGSFVIWDQIVETSRLSIDAEGNVGINQLYPRAKLDVVGDGNSSEAMSVDGNASFSGLVNVDGGATFSESVNVDGDATFSGSVNVKGDATFSEPINVDGDATFSGSITAEGISFTGNTTTHTSKGVSGETLSVACATGVVVGITVDSEIIEPGIPITKLEVTCGGS